MHSSYLTLFYILCISFLVVFFSTFLKFLNLDKNIINVNFSAFIERVSDINGNVDYYLSKSARILFNIPLELFFLKFIISNFYIIFFIICSLIISRYIIFFDNTLPFFFSYIFSLLIFLISSILLYKFKLILYKKFFIFFIIAGVCIYIAFSNPLLSYYWFCNTMISAVLFFFNDK
jgi:hypothetical protein